jgi:hypothetical protein
MVLEQGIGAIHRLGKTIGAVRQNFSSDRIAGRNILDAPGREKTGEPKKTNDYHGPTGEAHLHIDNFIVHGETYFYAGD